MKTTYKDIVMMQSYIDKKQDVDYRQPLKDKRADRLKQLQQIRLNILSHMKIFEQNLLNKSKTYFLESIALYERRLTYALKNIEQLPSSMKGNQYITLVHEQLDTINAIASTQTFEDLNKHIQHYVYLKSKIE
jgi:hypothetical protein